MQSRRDRNLYSRYLEGREGSADLALRARGRDYAYADLASHSARYANALTTLGVKPGERVCVYADKSPENVFLHLACLRAGLVYQPLNPALQPAELDYYLAHAAPALVACSAENAPWVRTAAARFGTREVATLNRDGNGDLAVAAAAASGEFATRPCAGSEPACLLHSSGTTGKPKGIALSHDNISANLRALTESWGFTAADRLLHALPLFHVHGLFIALGCVFAAGASLHLLDRFDAESVIGLLPWATVLMGVPTFYGRLLAHPRLSQEACASMRLFISGSAPLSEALFERFRARTGHAILERYGMSETGMNVSNPLHGRRKAGAVGMPLPGVSVKIAGPDGKEAPTNAVGELQVKGDNVFTGYWRSAAAGAAPASATADGDFTEDGYFRTGDLARRDEDGYIVIAGRLKDLIISGGENIYPKEIEQRLESIDGVAEAAVIGAADADLGERVVAVLETERHCSLDEAGILALLKTQLAGYKLPKQIHFIDALPRNTMGKVRKNALRETFGKA